MFLIIPFSTMFLSAISKKQVLYCCFSYAKIKATKGCAFMKKLLSVILASAMLFTLCPYAFAANDVYCRINAANISAIDTSLPGIQTVGDTTYHVGVGEVLSYDTHQEKVNGSTPGGFNNLASGDYGWVKLSSENRPVYTDYKGDTSAVFSLKQNESSPIAFYTFNKENGIGGDVSIEYKIKSDAETVVDLRFISSASTNVGWEQSYQTIYAFMLFDKNGFEFRNVSRKEDNSGDNISQHLTNTPALNKWITVRLDIHHSSLSYDLYADGKLLALSLPFHYATLPESNRNEYQKASRDLGYIRISGANKAGNVEFDDIALYKLNSDTKHYFGEFLSLPAFNFTTEDTLYDTKIPVTITDSNGADTGKTAYVPVRLSSVSSSEFAVAKAPIDGYSDKATVYINKITKSLTNNFEKYEISDSSDEITISPYGHYVQKETLADSTSNQFMKIYKSAQWIEFNTSVPANPGKLSFDVGFKFRFPDTTGFAEDQKFLSVQLNNTSNKNILTLNIEPEFNDSSSGRRRMRVFLSASDDSSFAGKSIYSIWAPSDTDWTKWHSIDMCFSDGKVQLKFDGNILTENNQGSQWENIRTDINFDILRFAHRTDPAASIDGISNIDDILVRVYPVIESLDNITYTTSLNNITVPENVTVSLTDATTAVLPVKELIPIGSAPIADKISQCGTYQYTVRAEGTDKTSLLTLIVIDKAYSLGKLYTNESTGNAVVPVFKATNDTNAKSLIAAQYKNGILSDVCTIPISSSGNIVTPIIVKDDSQVKAFLWDSFTTLKPVCTSADENLPSVTPQNIQEYDIVCWGDSLTYGQTEESTQETDKSYSAYLAALTGKTVKNMGIGGETAQTIAARQGGLTIAPSGAFTLGGAALSSVTFAEGSFNDLTGGHIVPRSKSGYCYGWEGVCYLNGIPGTITKLEVDESYKPRKLIALTFTRLEDGETLTVNEGESRILIPNGNMVKGDINVIFIGENGWHDINNDGEIDETDLSLIIDAMIKATPNPQKTIIIGLTTGTAQSRKNMEELMQQKYGMRYINMRAFLSSKETLENAGIEITQTDLEKIEVGALPTSLWRDASDYVHMNSKGYEIVANKIYQTMQSLGFLD